MSTSGYKCQRQSTEQSSPRAGSKNARNSPFAPSSPPTSSSSGSPSPPRRRDLIKNAVVNVIRKRNSTAVPQYRGVRYREELNKYVSEIRPTRCAKKIWLGTYDTAEEAARAFDIGNLCCNKNLPLNFADSPTMLKKISSNLSPEESRSAIAKLAKEVARLYSGNPSSSCEIAKPEPVNQAAMAHSDIFQNETHSEFGQFQTHSGFGQFQAFQPHPQLELVPQICNFGAGIYSETYFEQLPENVCAMEVATTMPMTNRGDGSRSWEFDLSIASDVSLPDDLSGIPILNDMLPDVIDNHMFEDSIYQVHSQDHAQVHMYQDQVSGGQVFGEVYCHSL